MRTVPLSNIGHVRPGRRLDFAFIINRCTLFKEIVVPLPTISATMQKERFYQLLDPALRTPKRWVVVSHLNPDGDAIGSSLAFSQFLRKLGHEVSVMVPNAFPGFLAWMPGADGILLYEQHPSQCQQLLAETDWLAMLDFNSPSRAGAMQDAINQLNVNKILIDHHRDPEESAYYCVRSETEVSSTSELVAEIILHAGESYLDESIATNALVGIVTDTGSFAHSVFGPQVFSVCAKLVEHAASYNQIHQLVYDTFSEDRLRLLGFAISHKMEVLDAYSTAIISLTKSELESFHFQVGDTEGIVNYPLSMKKIKMAVLVTERQGVIRLSFRSKGVFSVHELAQRHFNGGGHVNAAGGTLECSMEEALDRLHRLLPEYQALLNQA